ncbi:hypothetical protein AHAS_Ahas03G0188000 [Arachis hypogaea]
MKPFTLFSFSLLSLVLSVVAGLGQAQQLTPSSSPAPAPSSDAGTSLDQGIAYLLMLVALAITYMFH